MGPKVLFSVSDFIRCFRASWRALNAHVEQHLTSRLAVTAATASSSASHRVFLEISTLRR